MLSWKLNQILIILILCEIVFRSLISTITGKTWKLRTKHIESFQVDAIFNILPYPHNTVWWSIWMWQVLPIRLVHASSRKFLFRKSVIITTYLYRSILVPQSVFLEHFFLSMKHFYNYFISKMCPSWNRLNIQVPGLPQKCYSGLRNKEKTTIVVLGLFPSKVISIFMFVLLCCSSGSRKCSEELVSVSSGGANCRQSLVSTAFPFDHTNCTYSKLESCVYSRQLYHITCS